MKGLFAFLYIILTLIGGITLLAASQDGLRNYQLKIIAYSWSGAIFCALLTQIF